MIAINENTLRISEILKFIDLYEKFIDCNEEYLANEVSRKVPEVSSYIREAGVITLVNDQISGVYDLFENILDRHLADPNKIIDRLYSGLGKYQFKQKTLKRQLLNPLFWLGEFIRIPFHIMRHAGFDTSGIELSWLGKAYKAVSSFVMFIGAIVGILVATGINTKIFNQDNVSRNTQNIQAEYKNHKLKNDVPVKNKPSQEPQSMQQKQNR